MKGNRSAVSDTQIVQAAGGAPILSGTEANRRMLLLADLQAALAAHDIASVLARNHRLVLRSERGPCEPSGPTDPQLHIFTRDGTDVATTDGITYSLASGTEYPAGDPAATAALLHRSQSPGSALQGAAPSVRSPSAPAPASPQPKG